MDVTDVKAYGHCGIVGMGEDWWSLV